MELLWGFLEGGQGCGEASEAVRQAQGGILPLLRVSGFCKMNFVRGIFFFNLDPPPHQALHENVTYPD